MIVISKDICLTAYGHFFSRVARRVGPIEALGYGAALVGVAIYAAKTPLKQAPRPHTETCREAAAASSPLTRPRRNRRRATDDLSDLEDPSELLLSGATALTRL